MLLIASEDVLEFGKGRASKIAAPQNNNDTLWRALTENPLRNSTVVLKQFAKDSRLSRNSASDYC